MISPKRFYSLVHTAECLKGKNTLSLAYLPECLQASIRQAIKGYPRGILKADIERLKLAHKTMSTEDVKVVTEYSEREALAYAVSQMPFTHAPILRILQEIRQRIPEFQPKCLLDFGTGPGTAIWAASEVWPCIEKIVGVDVSEPMILLAEKLLNQELARKCEMRRYLTFSEEKEKFNAVIASFVFQEISDERMKILTLQNLLQYAQDFFIVVERGTPMGFDTVKELRELVLSERKDFHVFAPCAHDKQCPLTTGWCHFKQRVQLTPLQQELFAYKDNYEDQKFSYVVFRRGEREGEHSFWPRIVNSPLKRGEHVLLDVCDKEGDLKRFVASKSQGKSIYYDARKSKWGDLWPHLPKGIHNTSK